MQETQEHEIMNLFSKLPDDDKSVLLQYLRNFKPVTIPQEVSCPRCGEHTAKVKKMFWSPYHIHETGLDPLPEILIQVYCSRCGFGARPTYWHNGRDMRGTERTIEEMTKTAMLNFTHGIEPREWQQPQTKGTHAQCTR